MTQQGICILVIVGCVHGAFLHVTALCYFKSTFSISLNVPFRMTNGQLIDASHLAIYGSKSEEGLICNYLATLSMSHNTLLISS